jgi:hypothetical protein
MRSWAWEEAGAAFGGALSRRSRPGRCCSACSTQWSREVGGAPRLPANSMVGVVGWLVDACVDLAEGVLEAWVRPCLGSMPDHRWRWLGPSFTFLEASLHCCHTPLLQIWSMLQLRWEPMILVIRRWQHLGIVFPLGGLVFGAGHRQAEPVEG